MICNCHRTDTVANKERERSLIRGRGNVKRASIVNERKRREQVREDKSRRRRGRAGYLRGFCPYNYFISKGAKKNPRGGSAAL